jgi:hypothetical protein
MAQHESTTQSGQTEQPAKAKKPYVRVMTEKRREQNRRAQKAFREKQRQRLGCSKDNATKVEDEFVSGDLQSSKDRSAHQPLPQAQSKRTVRRFAGPVVIDFNEIFQANGDIHIPGLLDQAPAAVIQSSPTFTANLPQLSKTASTTTPNYMSNYWPMPPTDPSEPYIPPPADLGLPSFAPYHGGSLTLISRQYAYTRQLRLFTAALARMPPEAQLQLHSEFQTPSLPSPYLNHLTLTCETTLAASLSIGLSLGISHTQYLDDHPSPFPTTYACVTTHSLHLDPTDTDALASSSPINYMTRKHAATGLAPTLQPKTAQYLHPHPSYLDCIVFPTMRERAVRASALGTLDHVEFFLDLMHGGLVCWGGGSPVPTRNTRGGVRGRGHLDWVGTGAGGTAWSPRSWEARRWFLEKWEWLVGKESEEVGDGNGVWESSRWWWGVRGEEWVGEGWEGGGDSMGVDEAGRGEDVLEAEAQEGLDWVEGRRQGRWDGAREHEDILDELKAAYVPMSGQTPLYPAGYL